MRKDLLIIILIFTFLSSNILSAQDNFRVLPYLQNPGPNAITILWFSEEDSPGLLSYWKQDTETQISVNSNPISAEALAYSTWEDTTYFEGQAPSVPFRHRIRIETETGNYGFELQRRIGSEWQKVTFLEGNGTTSQPNQYEYLDTSARVLNPNIELYYRLKQIDIDGNYYYSDSIHVEKASLLYSTPSTFSFSQSYPNPFNLETTIEYDLPEPCYITVKISNLQGKIIRILYDGKKSTGFYKTIWDGKDESGNRVISGFYLYRIETSSGQIQSKRMVLLK